MGLQNISLITFGYFEKEILETLNEAVVQEFNFPVNSREGHLDLSDFFDNARRQYNATELLKYIDSFSFPESFKSVGLFNVDLFIPILTFIFGQAYLGGRSGIASLYRLTNEHYGIKKDLKILQDRFRKEVIHELGHTFGLIHCHNPVCVMRSSTYVEDIDQKQQHLCLKCRQEYDLKLISLQ